MSNNKPRPSVWQQLQLYADKKQSSMLKIKLRLVLAGFAWMLLAAVLLLTGCGHLPTPPCEPQPLPKMPALSEPLPSVSYSKQVQTNIESWEKRLIATPMTSRP